MLMPLFFTPPLSPSSLLSNSLANARAPHLVAAANNCALSSSSSPSINPPITSSSSSLSTVRPILTPAPFKPPLHPFCKVFPKDVICELALSFNPFFFLTGLIPNVLPLKSISNLFVPHAASLRWVNIEIDLPNTAAPPAFTEHDLKLMHLTAPQARASANASAPSSPILILLSKIISSKTHELAPSTKFLRLPSTSALPIAVAPISDI